VSIALGCAPFVAPATASAVALTERASVTSGEMEGTGPSADAAVSANGRFVAFDSKASLVPEDTSFFRDVYVRDFLSGRTIRVSVSTSGAQGSRGDSVRPAISASGRFVAFRSSAANLVSGDTNGVGDVFVRDRDTDRDGIFDEPGAVRTERVSVSSTEAQANGESVGLLTISLDGRFVAFDSYATNLTPGATGGDSNVFARDRQLGKTARISLATDGTPPNGGSIVQGISANGRFVVFFSLATNLAPTANGDLFDVFVRDRDTDRDGILDEPGSVRTSLASISTSGQPGNGDSSYSAISANGRYVAFQSGSTNLVPGDTNGRGDVFVRDLVAAKTVRISFSDSGVQGNGDSFLPDISADGRFVVFGSRATNLVSGDTNGRWDIFWRDRDTDGDGIFGEPGAVRTVIASVSSAGMQANGNSSEPVISSNGRFVAFHSDATNLVPNDHNGVRDIFRRGPL
jgi:Tol biopolymer transport system component